MYHFDKSKPKKRNILKRVSAVALSCVIVVALFSIFSLALPEGLNDYVSIYDSVSEIPSRTKTLTSSFEFAFGAVDDYTVRSGSEYGYAMIAVPLSVRSAYPPGVNNVDAFTDMLNYVFASGSYYYVFFDCNFTDYINDNCRWYMTNDHPVILDYFHLLPVDEKSCLRHCNYYVYDASGNFVNTGDGMIDDYNGSDYYGMFVLPTRSSNNNYYLTVQGIGNLVPVYHVWLNQPYFGNKYVLIETPGFLGDFDVSYVYTPAVSGKITSYYYGGPATTTYPDAEAVWQIGVDRFVDTFGLNYGPPPPPPPPPPPTDFASEIIRVSPILGTIIISLFEVPLLGWLLMVLGCFSLIGFVIYIVKNSLGGNGGDV